MDKLLTIRKRVLDYYFNKNDLADKELINSNNTNFDSGILYLLRYFFNICLKYILEIILIIAKFGLIH